MKFVATPLAGVYVIDIEPVADERGFFARTWCEREFREQGLKSELVQCSISFNIRRGTLRGMHYQDKPYEETKLVRCTRGAIYDVLIDLRQESASFMQWVGTEMSADNRRMLYVPPGVAHGFQTLEDDSEVSYQISEIFHPESARGVRWDDPALGITWPQAVSVISERDRCYPDFSR